MNLSDTGKIELGLSFHIPWWQFSDEDGKCLIRLGAKIKPKIIYEIGCWTGHSTSYLAQVAEITDGMVNCIDTFHGSIGIMQDFMKKNKSFNARVEFEKNMTILGLMHRVNILYGSASIFSAGTKDESIDFMFIDGNHSYSVVKNDIDEWWPKIRRGGILCGHDCETDKWNEKYIEIEKGVDGVHHGVVKAVVETFSNINIEHNRIWWVVKK